MESLNLLHCAKVYGPFFCMNFFAMFSSDSKSASSSALFDSHIECLQKILLVLAPFANFEAKPVRKGSKKRQKFVCLIITIGIHFRPGRLSL